MENVLILHIISEVTYSLSSPTYNKVHMLLWSGDKVILLDLGPVHLESGTLDQYKRHYYFFIQ